MPESHVPDNALPDRKPPHVEHVRVDPRNHPDERLQDPDPDPDTHEVRNINAPDLGGSFEENGQVRAHDGIGAGPGMQPATDLETQRVAKEENRDSSAGS